MDTLSHISLTTWLAILYLTVGLVLGMLQDTNLDSGRRMIRAWAMLLFWPLFLLVSLLRATTSTQTRSNPVAPVANAELGSISKLRAPELRRRSAEPTVYLRAPTSTFYEEECTNSRAVERNAGISPPLTSRITLRHRHSAKHGKRALGPAGER